ncbi:hypothetical protein HDU67_010259 [Dinochytrium kinnereticum]|nr:hypothetical protein HDU67_010259 [Dinochytrium kinnereticum]
MAGRNPNIERRTSVVVEDDAQDAFSVNGKIKEDQIENLNTEPKFDSHARQRKAITKNLNKYLAKRKARGRSTPYNPAEFNNCKPCGSKRWVGGSDTA